MRLALLASGRGSNVAALLRAQAEGQLGGAKVAGLVVNRPHCGALAHAEAEGVATTTVDHTRFGKRMEFERELLQAIAALHPDLIVLAGFMRILTPSFLNQAPCPTINLHPSLLPAFPGAKAIDDAFAARVRISGCTTHLVTAEVDAGPVLMQGVVPIFAADTRDEFAQRMHAMEHRLLPATVAGLAGGELRILEGQVHATEGFQPCILS